MYIVNNIYYKVGNDKERRLVFFLSTEARNKLFKQKKYYDKKYRCNNNISRLSKKDRIAELYQKDLNDIICEEIRKDSELKNIFLEYINLDIDPNNTKYNDWDVLSKDCSFDFTKMGSTKVNEDVEPVDGLKPLIELFDNDNEKFFQYIVQTSYFFAPELVKDRHTEILQMITTGRTIPARLSTVKKEDNDDYPYYKDKEKSTTCDKVNKGDTDLYYVQSCWKNPVKICVDGDGNKEVRRIIQYKYSNHKISTGKTVNTMANFTISHIWGNAFNPLFFTNLWNIAIVPTFCNFVFDKEESDENNEIINYVNRMMKAFFWDRYSLKDIIEAYDKIGFSISQWLSEPSKDDLEKMKKTIAGITIHELNYSDCYCKYIYFEHPIDDKKIRISFL